MDNIELQSVCDENIESLNNEVDKWKQINSIDLSDSHSHLASVSISGHSI
ncbi:hypothetical protein [Spiroplasma ixodetis]|uniref:Uncharacterized protein n=2 Tax=Spiroplasma TaxID=2132 RepID=A0ABN6SZG0_9MOLU|nr:hypothetical protein [Spiroplasma ixodetis]BDT02931.1 hypothetical protein SHM_05770 [Spiroplasma ixodetis]